MGLRLHTVTPYQGWCWMRDGLRLFFRRPLVFTGLFALFLLGVMLLMTLPFVGGVLGMAMLPLLTLGFMIAARSALREGPVGPGQFFEGLRGDPARRKAMLSLCLGYALATVLVIELSAWVDGGSFERLQVALARGEAGQAEVAAALADPALAQGMLVRMGLATLVSIPFWHAPALVMWGGQSASQALFSSTLAVWRAKAAFTVYSLAWLAAVLISSLLVAGVFLLLDMRSMLGVMGLPTGLMLSAAFYVSLWFSFADSFGADDVA
jgi:hypothetical protein